MKTETELLKPDERGTGETPIDSPVADVPSAEASCVARNATPQSEPTPDKQEDAPGVQEFTEVEEGVLDQRIAAIADAICGHQGEASAHQEAESLCWRELMPLLDEKQKLLTSRGKKSDKNITAYLRRNGLNPSTVRSWRRRLKAEQAAADGPEAMEPEEVSDAPGNEDTYEWQWERGEIETGQELLTKFSAQMLEVLTGRSILSNSMRIKRAVEMVGDLQRALSEGKLFDSASRIDTTETNAVANFAGRASIPELVEAPMPDNNQEDTSRTVAGPELASETVLLRRSVIASSNDESECATLHSPHIPAGKTLEVSETAAPELPESVTATECPLSHSSKDSHPVPDAPAPIVEDDLPHPPANNLQVPLVQGKDYTVEDSDGGYGIYEVGSPEFRWQWHADREDAWDVIDEVFIPCASARKNMEELIRDISRQ